MKRSEESIDNDYKYVMNCESDERIPKSDRIRSKLFQLNSLQNTFNESQNTFHKLRLHLMNELSQEIDRNDGKNSYLNANKDMSNTSKISKQSEWTSSLSALNGEQVLKKLNIKKKNINDIKSKENYINFKTDFNQNETKSYENDIDMNEITFIESVQKVPKTNIFSKVGLFSNYNNTSAIESKRNGSQLQSNCSPTRVCVSDIIKNSENSVEKKSFITGLERKLVSEVKSGSIKIDKAKNVLNIVRQKTTKFKSPLKTETITRSESEVITDERLKQIDPQMIETIEREIITNLEPFEWSKIAGLEFVKKKIKEIAILPLLRPEIFTGIRSPPKGILLFGPPGTGKSLIGRCIASETKSTFFSITVSSLTSKWIGEGEKMIKAMFTVARSKQPAVIFIDEIDSLLTTRCDSEHESSRRMKTEFLAQFDGVSTDRNERLLIIGATNRPYDLDDAARRRLSSKLYIPLPAKEARKQIIINSINSLTHDLTEEQIDDLSQKTEGYSGADMKDLCRESATQPLRDSNVIENIIEIDKNDIRGICYEDFLINLNVVKPSVSTDDLKIFEHWNQKYGTALSKSS